MRLFNIIDELEEGWLSELDVPLAGSTPAPQPDQGATTMAPGQQMAQDPQAQAKMQAQQAKDRMDQKKQLQDAIKQKQQELQDLQKQLAQIG